MSHPMRNVQSTDELIDVLKKLSNQECLGEDRYVRAIPDGGIGLMIRRGGPAGEIQQYIALNRDQLAALDVYRLGNTIEAEMEQLVEECRKGGPECGS